jgi:hypothetical protein
MANEFMSVLALGLFLALFVFLVLREFWTWYWKQSEQVRLLKQIAGSLERLEGRGGSFSPDHAAAVRLGLAPLTPPVRRPAAPVPATTG